MSNKLRVGITLGDINGVGPELIIKAFQDKRLSNICIPIVYGSARVLNIYKKLFQIEKFHYTVINSLANARPGTLNIVECLPELERVDIGFASPIGGQCALMALDRAIDDAMHNQIDVLVTLPVDKSTVRQHSEAFTGHTEMLTQAFGASENLMFMVSEEMRVGLVTNHVAVNDISRNLSVQKIVSKARIMHQTLQQDFHLAKPVIAVLGLNPHAGDDGLMGGEEKNVIVPALKQLQKEGIIVQGPFSPDGFFGSLSHKKFDGVLAMYHDQGLIPFKMMVGANGVNFTAGIPFVRTSPDHGVAYNIAGRGIADDTSFRQAIYTAIDIFNRRAETLSLKANSLQIEEKQVSHDEAFATKSFEGPGE